MVVLACTSDHTGTLSPGPDRCPAGPQLGWARASLKLTQRPSSATPRLELISVTDHLDLKHAFVGHWQLG